MAHRITLEAGTVLAVLFISAVSPIGQVRSAEPKSPTPPGLDSTHLELVVRCSLDNARPRTIEAWEKLAMELGMRQKDRESPWVLATAAGEVSAFAFFSGNQTSYFIMFFPASSESIPDAILSHLLNDASYTSVDTGKLEIGLGPLEQLPGGGTRAKSITVSVAGGRFLVSRTQIEWK